MYDLFRRWQRDGTWKRIWIELQAQADAKSLITWDVSVDSTVCRTHQHAAGARKAVECGINRLKRHRAVATRYEKLAVRYGTTVLIAAIDEGL